MSVLSLAALIIQATKEEIYDYALGIANSIGLPVSSWQPGDPTRSQFHVESELLSTLEGVVVGFIKSGFLDLAAELAEAAPDDPKAYFWLEFIAKQVFNVDVPDATAATTSVVLTNAGGGLYEVEPGDLTFKNTTTGKTFHNTTGGTLTSGSTLSIDVEADELGSAGSAGAGEIDQMVTALLEVTCSNPLAAIGVDKQSPATTVQQCRDKTGSLSAEGPKEAYSYVARNQKLTGTANITRVRVYPDSDTGDVIVYLAGPSGAVSEPDRVAVEAAIVKWALPLCITPTVLSAANVTVAVTYELWVYKSANKTAAEVQADVLSALQQMMATRPIGGDIIPPAATGALYKTMIESTIRGVYKQAFRVAVTTPSVDAAIGNGQVAALGAVTPTIHLVVDP